MLIALLTVYLLAMVAPFIYKKGSLISPLFFAAFTLGLFSYFLTYYGTVISGDTLTYSYSWASAVAVDLSFYLDGLSLFFALLITFFGVLILLYSAYYMKEYGQANRFFGILIFFMGSMLGLVLSANLISLFIFWELTSFSSYLLIGFTHKDEEARKSARQAWLLTATGGLALLAGFILLGIAGGDTYTITELLSRKKLITESPYLTAIIILVLLGAFTKSAQFPFHFWLPNAMAAPTPVSAYLHSATMVKAGIYLIFRFSSLFDGVELWQLLLTVFGGFTMLMGSIVAFRADDLKRVLAFATISALGIFVMMIGIGSKEARQAAMVYVFAHALYKATLFMVAGILDHECGTRKISELSQIPKKMPLTALSAVLAALSFGGIIPLIGFIGKELLYEAALHHEIRMYLALVVLVLSSIFFVAVCLKLTVPVFFHKSARSGQRQVQEAPALMYAAPLILGLLGLVFGIFPQATHPILEIASNNILNAEEKLDLSLWHGFNLVFMLSLGTIALGIGLYFVKRLFNSLHDMLPFSISKLPEQAYDAGWRGLASFATFQSKTLQSGYLRHYISVYVITLGALVLYYMFDSGFIYDVPFDLKMESLAVYEVAVLLLVIFTVSFIFLSRSRLAIIASIGITGFGIALSYALFSAPDAAITQFLVETLGLILLAIILPNLPSLKASGLRTKMKYVFIAAGFGLLMGCITLITMSFQNDSKLKQFFLENSESLGKGKNAVNVILVDFRALDTLGELSVLVITMVGIISLLMKRRENSDL